MFTDSSRIKDLEQLKVWMSSPEYTSERRKMFFRTFQKIRGQMHDQRLLRMRERLISATKAEDTLAMWKITNQIKDYAKEEKIGQRYE